MKKYAPFLIVPALLFGGVAFATALFPSGGGTGNQIVPVKGMVLVGSTTSFQPLLVGSDGQVIVADSASIWGIKWGAASGGSNWSFYVNGLGISPSTTKGIVIQTVATTTNLTVTSISGIVKCNGESQCAAAVVDSDYQQAITFTSADFDYSAPTLSIDYTNGQAASASAKGFLTAADFINFNISTTSTLEGTSTLVWVDKAQTLTNKTISTANNTITNAVSDGSTKGIAAFNANDFSDSSGVITLDYANGQKATASQSGFLLNTDFVTFSNKNSASLSGTSTSPFKQVFFSDGINSASSSPYITFNTANLSLSVSGTGASVTGTGAAYLFSSRTTSDLSEGANLYYTQARFNTAFSAKKSYDLGSATSIAAITAGTNTKITYNEWGQITSGAQASSDDLSAGTVNLFFTDARGRASAGAFFGGDSTASSIKISGTATSAGLAITGLTGTVRCTTTAPCTATATEAINIGGTGAGALTANRILQTSNDGSYTTTQTVAVTNGGTGAGLFTLGSIPFIGASGVYTQNNSQFFWDNTNNRLGIGTITPDAPLTVSSTQVAGVFATSVTMIVSALATSNPAWVIKDNTGAKKWEIAGNGTVVTSTNEAITGLTQFGVLLGGAGVTPLTTVNGLGSSTFVLTSNGAGTPPTWQAQLAAVPAATSWKFASTNAITPTSSVGIIVTASSTFTNTLGVGINPSATFADVLFWTASSQPSYLQNMIQNQSNSASASAEWVATNDTGNDGNNFVSLNMESSQFNNLLYPTSFANGAALDTSNNSGLLNISVSSYAPNPHINFTVGKSFATSTISMQIEDVSVTGVAVRTFGGIQAQGSVSSWGYVSYIGGNFTTGAIASFNSQGQIVSDAIQAFKGMTFTSAGNLDTNYHSILSRWPTVMNTYTGTGTVTGTVGLTMVTATVAFLDVYTNSWFPVSSTIASTTQGQIALITASSNTASVATFLYDGYLWCGQCTYLDSSSSVRTLYNSPKVFSNYDAAGSTSTPVQIPDQTTGNFVLPVAEIVNYPAGGGAILKVPGHIIIQR